MIIHDKEFFLRELKNLPEFLIDFLLNEKLLDEFLQVFIKKIIIRNFELTENENKDFLKFLSIKIKDEKNKDNQLLKKKLLDLYKLKIIAIKNHSEIAYQLFEKNKLSYTFAIFTEVSHKSKSLIKELYFQIISKENSIYEVAKNNNNGIKKDMAGLVGPVSLEKIHPKIKEILVKSKTNEVSEPFYLLDRWLIIKKEKIIEPKFTQYVKEDICLKLLNQYISNILEEYKSISFSKE
ncbi:peptidylprolyl isomerase [uncultured Prochlorococcus sp.]|uniref:peptidylprolyl isomerase n=1 Tax=uncultured Prochlorococcus sp. TaxID=159733 RepID=UPI00258CFA4E|nr:peptidylprolyl isomerase [uncultured Prochlorococcus sp.]